MSQQSGINGAIMNLENVPIVAHRSAQLRLLGGALGASLSLILAIIGIPTVIVTVIGLLGIPVGVLLGAALGPRVVASSTPGQLAFLIGLAAAMIGILLYVSLVVLGQSSGASAGQVLVLIPGYLLYIGLYGLIFGAPLTILVAFIAVWLLRRLAARSAQLWIPSAIALSLLAISIGGGVALVLPHVSGDQAAQQGDLVAFEYQLTNQSSTDYTFDVHSYWKGAASSGSSLSSLAACSSGFGSDWLQSSNWEIFLIVGNNSAGQDLTNAPLITSADWQAPGPVRLTINIDAKGAVSLIRGSAGQGSNQSSGSAGGGSVSQGQAYAAVGQSLSNCPN